MLATLIKSIVLNKGNFVPQGILGNIWKFFFDWNNEAGWGRE